MSNNIPPLEDILNPLLPSQPEPTGATRLTIDDMLHKYCGEFGPWQFKHFVFTSLAWALEAFHTMVMIFSDREPMWTCREDNACPPEYSICDLRDGIWDWVGGSGSSTAAEFGLVCGDKYKVGVVQALFFGGCMIGAGVFGHLSDSSLGRKGSLTIACILNGIMGFLTAVSPSYFVYSFLRFLTGFSTGGVGLCAFVLATEPIGPLRRGFVGMSTFYFFSFGITLLSFLAYVFPSWRALYIASSIPSLLFVILIVPFLSESPRWHLVRGRPENALEVMHRIASKNGKQIPKNTLVSLDNGNEGQGKARGTLVDVMKSPITRFRLILAVLMNFACSVVYYGLSLNAVNLGTDLHVSVAFNAIAEIPAYAVTALLVDRFGRRPLLVGTMWLSGVSCLLGSVTDSPWARMGCGVVGIFGMAGTYNLLFVYTTELFPTVVRNAALGCASQAAQMGAILAPFVVVLGGRVPFLVFGLCGVVGGLLSVYFPETLNMPLCDTFRGLEKVDGVF